MLRDVGKKKKVKSTLWIVLTSNFKISEKKRKTNKNFQGLFTKKKS